jgi:hypothetical protein
VVQSGNATEPYVDLRQLLGQRLREADARAAWTVLGLRLAVGRNVILV